MFGLIRRISHSVLPRVDRPWDDDATSNAPKTTSRKRRLSSTDPEREDGPKKSRGDTPLDDNAPFPTPGTEEPPQTPPPDVKAEDPVSLESAAAIPLPDDDDTESIASTPPAEHVHVELQAVSSEDKPDVEDKEDDDIEQEEKEADDGEQLDKEENGEKTVVAEANVMPKDKAVPVVDDA